VERLSNTTDHVVLYERNRALVDGGTGRVRLAVGKCLGWLVAAGSFSFLVRSIVVDPYPTSFTVELLLVVLMLGVDSSCALLLFLEIREWARLRASGQLLTGEVTGVDESFSRSPIYPPPASVSTYELKISYRFLTPSCEERTGDVTFKSRRRWPWLRLRPVPATGDQLAILYANGAERVM